MPNIDMPIQELQTYSGINPKPVDFDAYWERALSEMRAVDPAIELVPSEFQTPAAECFDLYFTGVRGARIHAKYARPRGSERRIRPSCNFTAIAAMPGDWADKLSIVSLGYSIFCLGLPRPRRLFRGCGRRDRKHANGHISAAWTMIRTSCCSGIFSSTAHSWQESR